MIVIVFLRNTIFEGCRWQTKNKKRLKNYIPTHSYSEACQCHVCTNIISRDSSKYNPLISDCSLIKSFLINSWMHLIFYLSCELLDTFFILRALIYCIKIWWPWTLKRLIHIINGYRFKFSKIKEMESKRR